MRDAGTELRKALGLAEPSYLTHPGPGYVNPGYHGGYRTEEDRRDFEAIETLRDVNDARIEAGAPAQRVAA